MIDLSTYARLHSLSAVALTEEQTAKSDITLFCFCAILLKVSSTSNELHRRVNFNLQFMRNRQPVNPDLVARKRQREVLLLTSEVRMKTKPQRSTSVREAGQKKIQEILIICECRTYCQYVLHSQISMHLMQFLSLHWIQFSFLKKYYQLFGPQYFSL